MSVNFKGLYARIIFKCFQIKICFYLHFFSHKTMLLQENTTIDKSMSSQPPPPEEDHASPERSDMFFEADDIDSITNDDSDDKPEDDVDTRFLEVSIGKFTLNYL